MKKICLFVQILVVIVWSAPTMAALSKKELLGIGGISVECTITKVGTYNFIGSTSQGEELNFATDSELQFVPSHERLIVGDKVKVIFFESESASRSGDKKFAYFVEFIEKQERAFLTGLQTCIVSLPKYRNGITCYFHKMNKLLKIEDINNSPVGSVIEVELQAIPARIGNGYVYEAITSEKMSNGRYRRSR